MPWSRRRSGVSVKRVVDDLPDLVGQTSEAGARRRFVVEFRVMRLLDEGKPHRHQLNQLEAGLGP